MTLTTDDHLPVTVLSAFLSPGEMRGGKQVWTALEDPFPEFRGGEAGAAPQAQGVQ